MAVTHDDLAEEGACSACAAERDHVCEGCLEEISVWCVRNCEFCAGEICHWCDFHDDFCSEECESASQVKEGLSAERG